VECRSIFISSPQQVDGKAVTGRVRFPPFSDIHQVRFPALTNSHRCEDVGVIVRGTSAVRSRSRPAIPRPTRGRAGGPDWPDNWPGRRPSMQGGAISHLQQILKTVVFQPRLASGRLPAARPEPSLAQGRAAIRSGTWGSAFGRSPMSEIDPKQTSPTRMPAASSLRTVGCNPSVIEPRMKLAMPSDRLDCC
jgi:hypothetical protein